MAWGISFRLGCTRDVPPVAGSALADLGRFAAVLSRHVYVTFREAAGVARLFVNAFSYRSDLLLDCERCDFVALNGEAIIGTDRASRKSSGHFHAHNDCRIVVFGAERRETEFVLLDCLHNPALDQLFSAKLFSFVVDESIVRKTGKNGFYVVCVAG